MQRSDIYQLHAPVFSGFGIAPIEQLFLAKAHSFDTCGPDPEGVDQRFPNGIGALLAQLEIILTVSLCIRMPYDQEAVSLQIRVIQSVRHKSDGLEGIRSNSRRVEVKLYGDGELRKTAELLGQRFAVYPIGTCRVANSLGGELPQTRSVNTNGGGLDTLKTGDDIAGIQVDLIRHGP